MQKFNIIFLDIGAKNLANPFANSKINFHDLSKALVAGLYSYDGWDVLNFGIEEIENPSRFFFIKKLNAIFSNFYLLFLFQVGI